MSKVITPEFRGSFVNLTTPRAVPGAEEGTEAYSITIVLPQDDPFWADVQKIEDELRIAKFGKAKQRKWRSPIKDGDDAGYDEHAGSFTLQAKTKRQPECVDKALKPIMDADELYSGAWYRASLSFYAWDHPTGGRGVSAALSNVMKIRDDEAFDGRSSATSDFADMAEDDSDSDLLD